MVHTQTITQYPQKHIHADAEAGTDTIHAYTCTYICIRI